MNLRTQREAVRTVIRDSSAAFITPDTIDTWLNEAQLDIATRMRLLHEEDTQADLVESGNQITLPTNFLQIISLRLGEDDVEVVADNVWNSYSDDDISLDRTLGRIYGGKIELYPTPDSGFTYTLRYFRKPAVLADDDDVPEIPENLHIKMVHYARAFALLAMGEMGQSEAYINQYERGFPNRRGDDRIWMGAPLSITLSPGPFDRDPDARHR